MRICFVNAFRRFSQIPPIPECVFAKRCRLQQASAFGVEIHHDTFFLSSIRDKFQNNPLHTPRRSRIPSFYPTFSLPDGICVHRRAPCPQSFPDLLPGHSTLFPLEVSPLFHCRLLPSSSPEAPSWIPAPPRPPSSRRH